MTPTSIMSDSITDVYLDVFIGDRDQNAEAQTAYNNTCLLLSKNAKIYGLPELPADLSEEQQDTLKELDVEIHRRHCSNSNLTQSL